MLSVSALRSGMENYFVGLTKTKDYYLDGGEPPGVWMGDGSKCAALSGKVTAKQLTNLMEGRSADGESDLVQFQKGRRRQPGVDLTFSAPKSVSVLWATADDSLRAQIRDAHNEAVKEALKYMAQNASWGRRGKGGQNIEFVHPIIAAFEHGTSRELDPQLHTHALWLNVAYDDEGNTGTIRSRDLFVHQMAGGAVYRASLEVNLTQIGLRTQRDGTFFRLTDVPESVCDHFSKRSQQMAAYLENAGIRATAKVKELAALSTRAIKGHAARGDLFEFWASDAEAQGFSASRVRQDAHPASKRLSEAQQVKLIDDALDTAIEDLVQRKGHFSQAQIVATALPSLAGEAVEPERVFERFTHRRDKELRVISSAPGHVRMTTASHAEVESRMLRHAKTLRDDTSHKVSDRVLEKTLRSFDALSDEQKAAVKHLTHGTGGLALLDGLPGVGKTRLLEAAREAWEAQGLTVVGAAVARRAASELEQGAGIKSRSVFALRKRLDEAGHSVADRLRHDVTMLARAAQTRDTWRHERKSLNSKTVLVLDEATMVSTDDLASLMAHAHDAGAKVVLCGGVGQLGAIEAGGGFNALLSRHGDCSMKLADIWRQKNEWERDAIRQYAEGDVRGALTRYAENGCIEVTRDKAQSISKLVDDWGDERSGDVRDTTVLAGTHAEVDALNAEIQELRKTNGELSWRRKSIGGGRHVHIGDVICIKTNASVKGTLINNGDTGVIKGMRATGIFPGEYEFDVELRRKESRPMALVNFVRGKERNIRVKFKTGDGIKFDLGYAGTVHSAQGGTYKKVFALGSEFMTSNESTFVTMTRAEEQIKFYLTDAEAGDDLREFTRLSERKLSPELALEVERQEVLAEREIEAQQAKKIEPPPLPPPAPKMRF